jgi:hypothetical protein
MPFILPHHPGRFPTSIRLEDQPLLFFDAFLLVQCFKSRQSFFDRADTSCIPDDSIYLNAWLFKIASQ